MPWEQIDYTDYDKLNRLIGDELRMELVRRKVSVTEMAKRLGISRGTLSKYLNGAGTPIPATTVMAICFFLNCNAVRVVQNAYARAKDDETS